MPTGLPGAGVEPQLCHRDDSSIPTESMTQPLCSDIKGALVKFLSVADMGGSPHSIFQIFNLESVWYFCDSEWAFPFCQ